MSCRVQVGSTEGAILAIQNCNSLTAPKSIGGLCKSQQNFAENIIELFHIYVPHVCVCSVCVCVCEMKILINFPVT